MKKTLLLLVALITATIAFAQTEIDGIYYNLNDETKTAEVTSGNYYSGDITIPEKVTYNSTEYSVTSIGSSAFSNCSSLTSITIPNSVTSIGSSAFYWCSSLTSISIPNSVTSIGNSAFSYCSSLTSISIPNSVTSIGSYAFHDCSSLTSISIPNSVTSIGSQAFFNCSSLTSITIPNSVTSIGDKAFRHCSSLTSIEVDANNPNYASIEGVLYNKDVTTLICCPGGKTSITIPNSVTSIAILAFDACFSLTSIEVDANNPNYASIEGVLYNKDVTTLICCPNGKTSITIPNSVTSIGEWAFSGCLSLTSITIPNSVTSIGISAFSYCRSLTSIIIPNSVTSIGDLAFQYCTSLTSITCLGSTPPQASALEADTENCTLKIPNEAYNDYLQHAYWGQFSNIETLDTNLYKKIEILVNDTLFGYVNVSSGYYCVNNSITIHAIPNEGYEFTQWSDGNTENPRTICITSDTTITAEFRVATTPTTVENTLDNQIKIYTTNGTLHVENATENYHILDAAGRLIYSGKATTLQLPRGIYLITINGEIEKIIL